MISGICIVMSPELRDLHDKEFSKLNEKLFKDYVSRWREEYNKPEGIPSKEDLISIIVKVTQNWKDYIDPDTKTVNIYAAGNENTILSNFAKRPFTYEEGVYDSVEQAFQIHKMLLVDPSDTERYNLAQSLISKMQGTTDPYKLKNLGNTRGVLNISELTLWDSTKFDIMKNLIRVSLQQNPRVLKTLLDTENTPITHSQASTDWRVKFPVILEELRSELKNYPIDIKDEDLSDYNNDESQSEFFNLNEVDISNLHKSDTAFTSIVKRNRIDLINRLFTYEVNKILEEETSRLNREFEIANKSGDKSKSLTIAKAIRNLRPYVVIKSKGPYALYQNVKSKFQDYIDAFSSNKNSLIQEELEILKEKRPNDPYIITYNTAVINVESKINSYNKILEYFDELARDAANMYGYTHNVVMSIDNNKISENAEYDNTNDFGYNHIENLSEDKEEIPYKEGWQVNVRELSAFSSMSNKVRNAISLIDRKNIDGSIVVDDLGYAQTLDASYVFAELVSSLKNMVDATDMIPMLENLAKRKPWASQILEAVKNDDSLFTSFYTVFRKDYLNMWIHNSKEKPDGSLGYKTALINKPTGTAHYFDNWRDNYEYGIVLDEDSVYDSNGEIIKSNAAKGLDIIKNLEDLFRGKTKSERQDVIVSNSDTLHKVLSMLGVQITSNVLNEVLSYGYNPDSKADLIGESLLYNLRTIFGGIKDNTTINDGEPADLINIYGTAFNNIATTINYVEEDEVESSTRQGKKTLYAHTRPSYMTTLVKKLSGPNAEDYIRNEYMNVDFLYDKKAGKWRNSWIENLMTDPEARKKFSHAVVIESDRKEYDTWTPLDAFLVLYNQYNAEPFKGGEGYAWYQSPLLSDATSAEFLRGKRYKKDYEKILLDKFYTLVMQEYDRIITVKQRANNPLIEKLSSFDMSDKSEGGAKFHFLPELNSPSYDLIDFEDNTYFVKDLSEEQISKGTNRRSFFKEMTLVKSDVDYLKSLVNNAVLSIIDSSFNDVVADWRNIGLFDRVNNDNPDSAYKYFNNKNETTLLNNLREYYWNTTYAQSQIIQLLTTDLAYYSSHEDFTKRALEFHSPTDKLNTLAKWDGKYVIATINPDGSVTPRKRRVIYLKDEVKPSVSLQDVIEVLNNNKSLNQYDKSVIISLWNKVNTTDAQALTTLKSYRQTQIMADLWDDNSERAYKNITNGTWDMKDFMVLWNTRKPYLYTQTNQDDGVGGVLRVPTQHKNSEMIIFANAIFGSVFSSSNKLSALSKFMEANDIDIAEFTTAVKVGGKGAIDLNGDLSEKETTYILESNLYKNGDKSRGLNYDRVHEFDFDDYGIQVATPDHGVDSESLVGTQIRRLIAADQSVDAEYTINGKKYSREEWQSLYNAVNVANIRESFEALEKIFNNPKELESILISEIKNSSRYNNDLIEAVTLNSEGQFNIPLYDFTVSQKLQELFNSIVKSRIVKQKIKGGSLIMASAWVLNEKDKPRIVWEGSGNNKRISYIEAYVPCPDSKLYDLLIDENGNIDINAKDKKGNYIVPEEYRKAIGYRIPTEDKYSMIPIRIKGFLPRQTGSVIILPEEVTTIMGADFDVDKIYMMYKSLSFNDNYDIKSAWDDFYSSHPEVVSTIEDTKQNIFEKAISAIYAARPDLEGTIERIEDIDEYKGMKQYEWISNVRPMFSSWFEPIKSKYIKSKSVSIKDYKSSSYDNITGNDLKIKMYLDAKKNSKSQRDNMIIDLMFSVLTNPDTVSKIINPGGFLEQKRDARIVSLLSVLTLNEVQTLGGVNNILSLSESKAKEYLSKYKKTTNPLIPDTWVSYQQRNMSGAGLVPMAATQNASHAITQLTENFSLKDSRSFIFNGNKLGSLHSVTNAQGEYISRNICSYLAAFVDNAKDPVAGDLNINEITANLAFTLLRIGNSPLTTSLILRQPATMDIIKLINSSKYSNIKEVIEALSAKYKQLRGNNPFGKKTKDFNFTDEWLAENISAANNISFGSSYEAEHDFYNRQLRVLVLLDNLFESAEAVGDVVRAVRSDTQSGAAGGNIASVNNKIMSVNDLLINNAINANHPLQGIGFIEAMSSANTEEDIITSPTPIQTAMFQYGLIAANKWLTPYFPQATGNFMEMVETAKKLTTYGRLDEDTINRITSHFIIYLMTQVSNDFSGNYDARNRYINEFPIEFGKFKANNSYLVDSLPVLKRLKAVFSNKYNSTSLIKFHNVGKVTDIQMEGYMSDFRNLSMHDNTRDFMKHLFIYHFYRGLGFSPSGFATMFPTSVKASDITDYVESLRKIQKTTVSDYSNFLFQYIRNNMDDRRFVPDVTSTGIMKSEPLDAFTVTVTKDSSIDMKKFIYPDTSSGIVYRKFVMYKHNNTPYYYIYDDSTLSYTRIDPLGNKNYQEYNALENASSMKSVISSEKKRSFDFVDNFNDRDLSSEDMDKLNDFLTFYDAAPNLTVNDLGGTRFERRQSEFEFMDNIFENNLNIDDNQYNALESLYSQLQALDSGDKDLEGNNRCK